MAKHSRETRLKGVPLSPGVAVGRGCFLSPPKSRDPTPPQGPADREAEVRRLSEALVWLAEHCGTLASQARFRIGEEEAAIFEAHRMIVEDPVLKAQIVEDIITSGHLAEEAITQKLGHYEVVDGTKGEVILNPSPDHLAEYLRREREGCIRGSPPTPGLRVRANIDSAGGAKMAALAGAEGVGLYRTELEVMSEGRLLNEEEQLARYLEVLEIMEGSPVYIRLLDIGSDKIGPWFKGPMEPNPALGIRGARLLLQEPDLLVPQARALAQAASRRPIHIIYPMIEDAPQFRHLKQAFESAIQDLPPSKLHHGVMFEIPSACIYPGPLLEIAEFGCVGTNDLIQYLFATDRLGQDHRAFYHHPALWQLLEDLAECARLVGRPLTVCGALASEPELIPRLMKIGIQGVSTAPSAIARVRAVVPG